MDSYYPNVEMVFVEEVNDIIDPLDTVDMDSVADIPAIKLELDDTIDSDEEFHLNENKSIDAKGTHDWNDRDDTLTNDSSIADTVFEITSPDDVSFPGSDVHDYEGDEESKSEPAEQKPTQGSIEIKIKDSTDVDAAEIEVKPDIKKPKVSISFPKGWRMEVKAFSLNRKNMCG